MDTIKHLFHNRLQRIEYDEVITRAQELTNESLNSLITGMTGAKSALLYGKLSNVSGDMKIKLDRGSFWAHRTERTKCVGIGQRKEIILDVDDETAGNPRKDLIKGRFVKTENRPKLKDFINELDGTVALFPTPVNTNVEYNLELAIEKGVDDGSNVPPELSSDEASYTGTVDLASPVDMTSFSKINLAIDSLLGGAFQEINLAASVVPTSVSITQMINNINSAMGTTVAYEEVDGAKKYLRITAPDKADSIQLIAPADSDATEYVLGLDVSPGYLHLFETQYPWFKVGEIWVEANESTEIQQDEIYGPDRQKFWTENTDPDDENDTFATPNVNELVEVSVPVGSIIAVSMDTKSEARPSQEFWAFCGKDADKPSNWSGTNNIDYFRESNDLPTDKFKSSKTVPDLSQDVFLMGEEGDAGGFAGDNDAFEPAEGTLTWTGSGAKPSSSSIMNLAHTHKWYDFTGDDSFAGIDKNDGTNDGAKSWNYDGAVRNFTSGGGSLEIDMWTSLPIRPSDGGTWDTTWEMAHTHNITTAPAGSNRPYHLKVHYFMRIK